MNKMEDIARKFTFWAWKYIELKDVAFTLSKPRVVIVNADERNNTYTVTLYYPMLKITFELDENENIVNYHVKDFTYLRDGW